MRRIYSTDSILYIENYLSWINGGIWKLLECFKGWKVSLERSPCIGKRPGEIADEKFSKDGIDVVVLMLLVLLILLKSINDSGLAAWIEV